MTTKRIWSLEHELLDPPYTHGLDCLDCLRDAGGFAIEMADGTVLFKSPETKGGRP